MDQMWSFIYTVPNIPAVNLIGRSDMYVNKMPQLLKGLHTHGVDWTNPSAWPVDFIDGRWAQIIPIPFLLEGPKVGGRFSINLIQAICEGDLA